jgi:uncharacterized membrane protein
MKITLKIFLLLVIATISGCYYDSEERLYPNLYDPCNDTEVTFSRTVTTILQPCQLCHSNSEASKSGSGIKLQDYNDVMTVVSNGRLIGSVSHAQGFVPMPNGTSGKLPECEIAQLQKWIDNGSPNN